MIKATRVNHKIAGWVSFKLTRDGNKKTISKEELINLMKMKIKLDK